MQIRLDTRRAIVTGSTAGIGLAIASGLAAAGAHVTITGRTQERVDEAGAAIARQVPGARVGGVGGETLSEYLDSCGALVWTRDLIYAGGQFLGAHEGN